jgi:peptidyl-prolyl cis-trans isomerase B (cyclophilin B)
MERGTSGLATPKALMASIGVLAAILAGCGGGNGDSNEIAGPTVAGCAKVGPSEPKQVDLPAPEQTVKRGEALTALVKTSCGSFEIALDTTQAPRTVNSFAYLAREGVYDGLDFYKVASGFAVYGGDPAQNGTGGPGYSIVEKPPADTTYGRGVVAMDRTEADPPGYSGSHFFVATSTETGLPPDYALLGTVSKAYKTIARIQKLDTTPRIELPGAAEEKPRQTAVIEEVTIKHG